jgi:hypothetical protein
MAVGYHAGLLDVASLALGASPVGTLLPHYSPFSDEPSNAVR